MARAWAWARAHASAIVGSIIAVLSAIIAVGAYRRRIGSLKDQIAVEKAQRSVAVHETRAADLQREEAKLAPVDHSLADQAAAMLVKAGAARADVEGKSDAQVVQDLNERYARARRPPAPPAGVRPVALPPPMPGPARRPGGGGGGSGGKSGKG